MQIRPPINTKDGFRITRRYGFQCLSLRIRGNHYAIRKHTGEITNISNEVKTQCSERLWRYINREIKIYYDKIFQETKIRHNKKLERLINRNTKRKRNVNPKWIVNKSSRNLNESEKSILSKGLNFAPAPRKIPVEKFIIETESAISNLEPSAKAEVRNKVTNILASAKSPDDNLTKDEKKALRSLKDDNNIIILRADKGNATVVMDRTEYETKIKCMLNDTKTYLTLKADPAKKCETKMKNLLSGMKERIPDKTYKHLCTTDGTTPRLYGVPKIHKDGIPLRPIISYIGSPTYQLSKHLVTILSPLVGNTTQHLRNSKEWVDIAQQLMIDEEELVSFDVVSLFTSIPTDIAVTAAKNRLELDTSLQERTQLTSADITSLLSFCLNSTEFSFKNNFYQQIHGTAMGSPISVVTANLVMEVIESRALTSFIAAPRIFKRYVDDTICVIKKGQIEDFHEHLNKQDNNIKFTIERYTCAGLPFLDTLNKVSMDGSIQISMYRKKTHTDKYLDFTSHHPPRHMASVVRTLAHRKDTLLQDEATKQEEHKHIMTSLKQNGYPANFIKKHSNIQNRKKDSQKEDQQPKGFAVLPYVKGTTERISRVLTQNKIKTCVKPHKTLKQILSRPKDPVRKEKQTGIVYSIPCDECEVEYIGETGRALETRKREHQAAVRLMKKERSALAEHCCETGHAIKWDSTKILNKEQKWHQRKWAEAWQISKNKSSIFNKDSGRILPLCYHKFM